MSFQYDQYLARHRANVKRGFDWLSENLPGLMTNTLTAGWNTEFAHDRSKNEPDEYEAYDAYFYGNNRSYEVVQRYQRAWLLHIHRNPHHWQHWILIHDDMENGELETVLEMPYDYEPSLQPILKERHIPKLKLIGLGTMQEAKNKDVRKLHF